MLFTSGLVVGMKIDQRENYFSNNEVNSFRNVNSNNGQELSIDESSSDESIGNKPQQSDSDESFNTAQETGKSTRTALPSIQKDLKYPPRLGQVNYIIQIGTFSREDANKWGAQLIKERQEFQGRLFRTSTGKLYLGYYYNLKEAKQTLKRVKKFRDGVFEEAGIKNIHF